MLNKKSGNARGTKSVSRNRGGIKNHLGATLAVLFAALTMAILGGIVGIGTAPASAYYIKGSTQVINAELLPSIGITVLDNTASSVITDLTIDILPSPTGTFGKNSAIADVFTTNRTGYTLYISSDYNNHASTATNSLINTNTSVDDTTTSSIGNIPTLSTTNVSESAFSAANSSYKNQWGYSDVWSETIGDDSYSGGSATTYNPVPVKNTQATIRDDVDRQVSSSRTTIGVGVNVDTNKASGTYRNKLVFTAVAKPTLSDFTLTFDANGGTGAPVDMTGTSSAMSRNFTVPNETPTWAGRTFLGWADSNDATEPDYRIGDTVTVYVTGAETTATKTVYAVWQANYMQDYDVRTLAVNEKITLLDKRDNTPYTVQKFNNGETWMISNLKLGYDKGYTLTDELTNIVDGNTYYIPKAGYQGSITNPATVTDTSTAANFSTANDNLAKIQYREEGSTDNTTGNPVPEDTGYYNFYTATLGFSYYNDGKTSGSSPQDICPKGWSLPVNGGATTPRSWSALDYVFNPDDPNVGTNRTNATARDNLMTGASLGYSGYYALTQLNDVGNYGNWQSSTVHQESAYAYNLQTRTINTVHPQNRSTKFGGRSVRCVSKLASSNYMQDFDSSNLQVGSTMVLRDKRDDTAYTVKKFSDGSVWMTSNLKLGYDKGYALTNELTNIPDSDGTTYYIPQAGYQGDILAPSTQTSTATAANFSTTNDDKAKVQYRAKGSTDNTTGEPVPEDTGYYNFYTATLGFSYYNDGKTSGSAPADICPKNWQLPVNGDKNTPKSWSSLDYILNPTDPDAGTNRTNAVSRDNLMNGAGLRYDGYYLQVALYRIGLAGLWWSSTIRSTSNIYYLGTNSDQDSISPQNIADKYTGRAMRCVYKN